jgi:hypothetical protein
MLKKNLAYICKLELRKDHKLAQAKKPMENCPS